MKQFLSDRPRVEVKQLMRRITLTFAAALCSLALNAAPLPTVQVRTAPADQFEFEDIALGKYPLPAKIVKTTAADYEVFFVPMGDLYVVSLKSRRAAKAEFVHIAKSGSKLSRAFECASALADYMATHPKHSQ